jgi:hypothetical protein
MKENLTKNPISDSLNTNKLEKTSITSKSLPIKIQGNSKREDTNKDVSKVMALIENGLTKVSGGEEKVDEKETGNSDLDDDSSENSQGTSEEVDETKNSESGNNYLKNTLFLFEEDTPKEKKVNSKKEIKKSKSDTFEGNILKFKKKEEVGEKTKNYSKNTFFKIEKEIVEEVKKEEVVEEEVKKKEEIIKIKETKNYDSDNDYSQSDDYSEEDLFMFEIEKEENPIDLVGTQGTNQTETL